MIPEKLENYSVLMAVYKNDKPEYLKIAIDSMLTQTILPEQFVIVEDGVVREDIEQIIKYYETDNGLFTIIRLEKNGGLGNALNKGLEVCRNELVARMDADDISMPERCERQLKRFSQKPELCILGTQIKEFIGNTDNVVSRREVPCAFEDIKEFARRRSPFNHPTVMFRRSEIQKFGGYFTLNRKEDLSLFVSAVNSDMYSENLSEALLFYRTNEDNQKRRKTWVNCKEYIQVMYGFYKKGFLGIKDLLYVLLGQFILFAVPNRISKLLSNKFLRKKERGNKI